MVARCVVLALWFSLLILSSNSKKIIKDRNRGKTSDDQADETSTIHDQRQFSLVIEHAVGNGPFTRRGAVHLKSLKATKDATFQQESLTALQLKNLHKAAATNGLYSIRTSARLSPVDEDQSTKENVTYVSTIISACALLKSNLRDRIVVNGDGKGSIYGLTMLPFASVLSNEADCSTTKVTGTSFSTVLTYSTGETGIGPNTQAYIQKLDAEKAKKETEDNRSFFQKYWMYLLIGFVAFQLLAGSAGQGAAAAGGGSGGGGGQ